MVPDANILSVDTHLELMRAIGEVQDAPVIADIDTGCRRDASHGQDRAICCQRGLGSANLSQAVKVTGAETILYCREFVDSRLPDPRLTAPHRPL